MDSLKVVKGNLDLAIDPDALPGQIFAQDHNDVFTEMLSKVGKYVGLPFVVKGGFAEPALGEIYFDRSLNLSSVVIQMSTRTMDLNASENVVATLESTDIMHVKDFEGRSSFFRLTQTPNLHPTNPDVYQFKADAMPGNANYQYTGSYAEIMMVEFFKSIKEPVELFGQVSLNAANVNIPNTEMQKFFYASYYGDTIAADGKHIKLPSLGTSTNKTVVVMNFSDYDLAVNADQPNEIFAGGVEVSTVNVPSKTTVTFLCNGLYFAII